jgi:flagellar protein FliO/FliZ
VSRRFHRAGLLALSLVAAVVVAAAAAVAATPSAPFGSATAAPATATPGLGSLTQVSLALALVLGLVFGLAWLLRRVRGTRRPGAPGIDILAEVALGPKERAVLLQVERVRLLVGVTAGQVRTLHVLPEAEPGQLAPQPAGTGAVAPSFAELLRRSLGR